MTSQMLHARRSAEAGPLARRADQNSERNLPRGSHGDIRTRLSLRLQELDTICPTALDLLASVHLALHGELHGCASALRGPKYTARNWRDVVLGERDLGMKDLCRLAVSSHPRARAAALRAVRRLASALGYDLTPAPGAPIESHEALAQVTEAAAAIEVDLARELGAGKLEPEKLGPEIDRLEASLVRLRATVRAAA
jgi:hypothetical protein